VRSAARRFLPPESIADVPQREPTLILVDQKSYQMRLYRSGVLQGEYEISLGQGTGRKHVEGDNKIPQGMYYVIQKHRGEFGGEYGRYYDGHWIKANYPNKYDAAWGAGARAAYPAAGSGHRREMGTARGDIGEHRIGRRHRLSRVERGMGKRRRTPPLLGLCGHAHLRH